MKTMIIAALGVAAFAGAASAADQLSVDQTKVRIAVTPSDVATPGAAQGLLNRLGVAAMQACGAFPGSVREYQLTIHRSACFQQKLDAAVAQVDSPLVSRIYDQRGPMMVASIR